MKNKYIVFIGILILLASVFASCVKADNVTNNSSTQASTTVKEYYSEEEQSQAFENNTKIKTEKISNSSYANTDSKGKDKSSNITTSLSSKSQLSEYNKAEIHTTNAQTTYSKQSVQTVTTTKAVTDAEGWINNWY